MVSTRQMSTSSGQGGPGDESCARLLVVSRQSSQQQTNTLNPLPNTRAAGFQQITEDVRDEKPPETQRIFLLDLPIEILDNIFSYVEYKKVGQIRVISQQMNQVCSAILNSTFSRLQNQMLERFHTVKAKMPRRESARRNHPLSCESDIIETCHMRLSLLQMTFGKHIERKHCCFFPGAILDEVYNVLNYIRTTPKLERPYRVTDELFDLSTMAMEYFKEHMEPRLPEIAYFSKGFYDLKTKSNQTYLVKPKTSELVDNSSSSPPQSNMVLRKGIRKIKQGMKMYNNQLTVLRSELRTCKKKSQEQAKQIAEQQKLLAEQQKQTLEYANRLDENDKKNEEMSRKFSTLLQELNKCKTELQYWRSKSPATQVCTSCGHRVTAPLAPEDFQALVNQGVKPEDINISVDDTEESDASNTTTGDIISFDDHSEFLFPGDVKPDAKIESSIAIAGVKRRAEATITSSVTSSKMAAKENFNVVTTTIEKLPSDGFLTSPSNVYTESSNLFLKFVKDVSKVDHLSTIQISNTSGVGANAGVMANQSGDVIIENQVVSRGNGGSGVLGGVSKPSAVSASSYNGLAADLHNSEIVAPPPSSISDTKKARRVQNKGSRCQNVSNKRSK